MRDGKTYRATRRNLAFHSKPKPAAGMELYFHKDTKFYRLDRGPVKWNSSRPLTSAKFERTAY